MKKFLSLLSIALLVVVCSLSLFGCGGSEVDMRFGDGNVENDSIGVKFTLDDKISDGYKLKGSFYAESDAKLDRKVIFSISLQNGIQAGSGTFTEQGIFELDCTKLADGTKLDFEIEFPAVSDFFPETEETATVYFNLHDVEYSSYDVYNWSTLGFKYTNVNGQVTFYFD